LFKNKIWPDNLEIIMYQTEDGLTKINVQMENDNVWLTQAQMTELFQTSKQNISLHVGNVFSEGELDPNSVVKDSLTTAADGKKYKKKFTISMSSSRLDTASNLYAALNFGSGPTLF